MLASNQLEHDPIGHAGETGESGQNWCYTVYCYEREQGHWVFSQNTSGSFDYRREYALNEEEAPYCGWMDQGKLYFASFDDAADFVHMHVRTKDDVNLLDSIYDIFYVNEEKTEIQVAHYWFNADTGSQIQWESPKSKTDWNKVESG